MKGGNNGNYEVFRDCVSAAIIEKSSRHKPRHAKKRVSKARKGSTAALKKSAGENQETMAAENGSSDPAELADFIEVSIPQIIILAHVTKSCSTLQSKHSRLFRLECGLCHIMRSKMSHRSPISILNLCPCRRSRTLLARCPLRYSIRSLHIRSSLHLKATYSRSCLPYYLRTSQP